MNRLQKKCLIATAGVHLLLLVILLVGPAFFQPRHTADNMAVLDVIPANLVDAAVNSGVQNAQPPPPASVVTPPAPQPQPTPPPPKPAEPAPTFVERMEKIFKSEPAQPVKPDLTQAKPEPHKIQVNTQLVTRNASQNTSTPDNAAQQARALRNAIRNLKKNFSPGTTIDMPGNSSAAYANYANVVKSIYEQAWVPPDNADNDEANTKVRVTIANDGTVISARILESSGDAGVDASVQRTLERVQFIAPFPEGATEKERTYIINFNLKAKRMLG